MFIRMNTDKFEWNGYCEMWRKKCMIDKVRISYLVVIIKLILYFVSKVRFIFENFLKKSFYIVNLFD